MKICFILNPRSGRNARRPWLAGHIRDFIAARSLDAGLVITTRPRHATELAQDAVAAGCTRVVAVGGDGTMNEIAQALLHSPAALGLVPCGSGNGLALHLSLPTRLDDALALATDPTARIAAIDTGSANGRPFFNAMGSGFDADISRRFNLLTRRGLPAYARIGFSAFRARRPEWVVIHGGGQTKSLLTLFVSVANSDQYGNNARIAPGARVDDGQLDLVAVRPVGFVTAIPLVARMFLGKISSSSRVFRLRSARFLLERSGPGLIHTDGETHETGALVEIKVHPRSLRLVVPALSRVQGEPAPPVPTESASLPRIYPPTSSANVTYWVTFPLRRLLEHVTHWVTLRRMRRTGGGRRTRRFSHEKAHPPRPHGYSLRRASRHRRMQSPRSESLSSPRPV